MTSSASLNEPVSRRRLIRASTSGLVIWINLDRHGSGYTEISVPLAALRNFTSSGALTNIKFYIQSSTAASFNVGHGILTGFENTSVGSYTIK